MALVASEDNPEKEKQISIDPISLSGGVDKLDAPNLMLGHQPPALPTTKFKFISSTVPNSASSTPRFVAPVTTNNKVSSLLKSHSSTNQQCAGCSRVALRSMSSGPCDDMDRWINTPNTGELGNKKCISKNKIEDKTWVEPPNAAELHNNSISKMEKETKWRDSSKETGHENQFKCGALCLFLPGLGKGKPVQAKNDDSGMDNVSVISRRVSFEKFDCGSWASSAIEIEDDGNSGSLYFDLPLELIRNSVDAHAPDNSAFVFNKDRKGVLNQ